ncbi:hypothetical protein H7686_0001085 [Candidatus Phytoplasma asiaticum]|uniref:Uncharacterized protein n=1 Tax=Candidatus Phytoplasma asiaticum TaxID=2763338 RepID=A0AAX3B9Q0_9MOLU|nr:hypothetical protein ['Parthenium hysterophorus' phyllody phytoplasma]UQV27399.1 hypothetical protein H7686_0001085 ['Parthenium hysterophorus' phyllody phytoplasma]
MQCAYLSICARIDRDLAKLEADEKDYQQRIADYQKRQEKDNLEQEIMNSVLIKENINKEFQSWINEYRTISKELTEKQKEVSDTSDLFKKNTI